MDGKVLATMDDGTLEAAVFETSYGYVVTVRWYDHALGTKPFHKLADAMAYAELLTKDPDPELPRDYDRMAEHWSRRAACSGELAILFSHQRYGERVGLLDTSRPSSCGPHFSYVYAKRAGSAAFEAMPEWIEYPRRLDRTTEETREPGALCECGHPIAHHVADRLPCLVQEDDVEPGCPCRAFKRQQPPIPPPQPQPWAQPLRPGSCPKCQSPHFDKLSASKVGTSILFLVECRQCGWVRRHAEDEDADSSKH